jgi:hypothetical protein
MLPDGQAAPAHPGALMRSKRLLKPHDVSTYQRRVGVTGVSLLNRHGGGGGPATNSISAFTALVKPLASCSGPSAARGLCRQYPPDA